MKNIAITTVTILLLASTFLFSERSSYATEKNLQITEVTENHARALRSLNSKQAQENSHITKSLRVKLSTLTDNQGQKYLGALISKAELSLYLAQLQTVLTDEFEQYRVAQSTRDHQLFHMTLLSPKEYQMADKVLINKLLDDSSFSTRLTINLLGLGSVTQKNKSTYFIVAQSADGQLARQRFLLPAKDFHITLAFKPMDIYGVKKDTSTLVNLEANTNSIN